MRSADPTTGGHARHEWLESRHTFSFADYRDPAHMGFRTLRVINEDWIEPGRGFPTHPHRDMEIITWVLEGELEHSDSMGNASVIRPGDIQLMRAGTGVTHSEFNHSPSERLHLLQIWILPEAHGLEPAYAETRFEPAALRDTLRPIVTPDGRDGSLRIRQDVVLQAGVLAADVAISSPLAAGRHAWLQVARGRILVDGETLDAGDGAAVSDEARLDIRASEEAEVLLFDLA